MGQKGEYIVLSAAILLVLTNITGIVIPFWYRKGNHEHTVNSTNPQTDTGCVVSMYVQEGLWQRYCIEVKGADCVRDVKEWCDNLEYPDFVEFVVAAEIVGDLFVIFAISAVFRGRFLGRKAKIEMVGAEIGLGGLLMVIGDFVYAAADSGDIGYIPTDLHVGWGLCLGTGITALVVFVCCLCLQSKVSDLPSGYFPISDQTYEQSDEEMIEM